MEHTISGLQCQSDYLNAAQQQHLLTIIDDQHWLSDLKRRVWKHGIPSRKSDLYEGRTIQRLRRVSITLRTIATQPA